jgi:hypothetical protein
MLDGLLQEPAHDWSGVWHMLGKSLLVKTKTVDWKTAACVAGYFPVKENEENVMPWTFSKLSRTYLAEAKMSVLPADENYVTIHWRRGDQLVHPKRCDNKESGGPDSSLNCKNKKLFVKEVFRLLKKYNIPSDVKVFVATNGKLYCLNIHYASSFLIS